MPATRSSVTTESGEYGDEDRGEDSVEGGREGTGPGVEAPPVQQDQQVADRGHGDQSGQQQGGVKAPRGEQQTESGWDGGLNHHGTGDVRHGQGHFSLSYLDDRVHDL